MYTDGKPYYSLNSYVRDTFGHKLYRIPLNAGMTCPTRDGTLGTGGCIFCSEGGSGDFAGSPSLSITEQIDHGISALSSKIHAGGYIAYFQAYSNTYAPAERLRKLYFEALAHPKIEALSIATRPDCLPDEVLSLLAECQNTKPVWIELGLQSIHEKSARFIRRGYGLPCFETAVANLRRKQIAVIVHTIIGLPTESAEDFLSTIRYLNTLDIQGVKLQLLHVLKHTDLADYYSQNPFPLPTLGEYCEILGRAISLLRPDIAVHRLTGDGPEPLLIAPLWTKRKKYVLNTIISYLKDQGIFQGKEYSNV